MPKLLPLVATFARFILLKRPQINHPNPEITSAILTFIAETIKTRTGSIFPSQQHYTTFQLHINSLLTHPNHIIRCQALSFLSLLAKLKQRNDDDVYAETSISDIQLTYLNFLNDEDDSVRCTCLESLLQLHISLPLSAYSRILPLLQDSSARVRIHAINLIWTIRDGAHDVFLKVADMVNDVDVDVRVRACSLLGTFKSISQSTLLQTLNKNKLSTSHRQSQSHGSFIHGLEDEFQAVRHTSVDAISELALHSPPFAAQALDLLIDAFNDESEGVRLNAILSLIRIWDLKGGTELESEQIESATLVLRDLDWECRRGGQRLLGLFKTTEGLAYASNSLYKNLKRFPSDEREIYRCFKGFGRNHPDLIQKMIPKLLKLDSRFLAQEQYIHTPTHISNIIMIFNAAEFIPEILNSLPEYAFKHCVFVRSKFPDCLPEIHIEKIQGPLSSSLGYWEKLWEGLQVGIQAGDNGVLECGCTQLLKLTNLEKRLDGPARFLYEYLKLCLVVLKIRKLTLTPSFSPISFRYSLIKQTLALKYSYVGLSRGMHETLDRFLGLGWVVYGVFVAFSGSSSQEYLHYCKNLINVDKFITLDSIRRVGVLLDVINNFEIPYIEFPGMIKKITAILSISGEFNAIPGNVPVQFPIVSEIRNISKQMSNLVLIKVDSPDGTRKLYVPDNREISFLAMSGIRIDATVELIRPPSEGYEISFSVVLAFEYEWIPEQTNIPASPNDNLVDRIDGYNFCTISNEVRVCIGKVY